jgi:remodeling and spacing factor 1
VNAEKEELAAAGVGLLGVGKDSQGIKRVGKLTDQEDEQEEAAEVEEEEEEEDGYIPPVRKFLGRKKHRRLNSLDISSEDDADSDEDFKGSRYCWKLICFKNFFLKLFYRLFKS